MYVLMPASARGQVRACPFNRHRAMRAEKFTIARGDMRARAVPGVIPTTHYAQPCTIFLEAFIQCTSPSLKDES